MSAEIVNTADGILTVRITGKLTFPEMRAMQNQATSVLRKQDKTNLLLLMEDFQGREQGTEWQDKSWQKENHPFIGKVAVVGDKKWEEMVFMFLWARNFPLEYFQPNEVDKARIWLGAKS
jgi:hypothetical protein